MALKKSMVTLATLMNKIYEINSYLLELAIKYKINNSFLSQVSIVMTPNHLELRKQNEPKLGAIFVDFTKGAIFHRCHFGNKKNEAIAKAVGIRNGWFPNIVDATAGFGRDAFILSSLGCNVCMFEQNPIVAALLYDGLYRAYRDPYLKTWITKRLTFMYGSSLTGLTNISPKPDVIYIDPMYPIRKKKSLVKKEMQLLRFLIGPDNNSDKLLSLARSVATRRVVVKRPKYAPSLAGMAAQAQINTKRHRFDVYIS